MERKAQAALQLHGQAACADRRAAAIPAAEARAEDLGISVQHRPRARLPLSVLVLHHHQRARPQEPVSHAERSRNDRENHAQGIKRFFITDDNFARNRDWELLFDRIIHLRKTEFPGLGFTIQVDTLCHKIPNFIEKAAQAGVRRVFIGLENINPDNLIAAKKRQNKITEYREMLQKWRDHGAITYAGYILGFPADTKESIARDIEIIKRELPLDILEFFFLTPLPGSEVPQGAFTEKHLDGSRHELVRSQPPRFASFHHERCGMGGRLSCGLVSLLYT